MMRAERGMNKRLRSAPLSGSGVDLSALSVEVPSEMLKAEGGRAAGTHGTCGVRAHAAAVNEMRCA